MVCSYYVVGAELQTRYNEQDCKRHKKMPNPNPSNKGFVKQNSDKHNQKTDSFENHCRAQSTVNLAMDSFAFEEL